MYDLDIARLIHSDREREIVRGLRASALRRALDDREGETFVPRPSDAPVRISHPLRLLELRRLG
jgi:hypothetical protein